MSADTARTGSSEKLRRIGLQLGAGMATGLVIGGAAAAFGVLDALEDLDPFLGGALLMGLGLGCGGLLLIVLSFRPRALTAVMAEGGGEGAATPREAAFYRLAGWVILLAGVLAAAPPLAVVLAHPVSRSTALVLLAAITAVTLLQAVLNVRLWSRADELTRRASMEGACLAFFVVEGLLFLWAAAQVLGVAPQVSAWAIWTLMFAAYLVVAGWVAYRRGVG